jgi:curved DNA-binding protein CbpA
MPVKDYYKILELEPSATLADIKKAYRRLALQYHPDKNAGKEYAQAHFIEIKEAYEVLTSPSKKQVYLQQRWYEQSAGKKEFNSQPVTPPYILKKALDLDKYVSSLDNFRMDKQGLYEFIVNLLSTDTIDRLKKFNETEVNKEIIRSIIHTAGYLPPAQAKNITSRLYDLGRNDRVSIGRINLFLLQMEKKARWEKYKIAMIIFVTIIISLLIYIVGSR